MVSAIIIALLSAAAFLVVYLVGKVWWIALLAALVVGIVGYFIMREPRKRTKLGFDLSTDYNPAADLASGRKQLKTLEKYTGKLKGDPAQKDVISIIDYTNKIFDSIEKNNVSHDTLKRFVDTFLPTMENLLDRYTENIEYNLTGKEAVTFIGETRKFLSDLSRRLSKILDEVHSPDILEATVERETLKVLMDLDGIDIFDSSPTKTKEATHEE